MDADALSMDGEDLLRMSLAGAPLSAQRDALQRALAERGVPPSSVTAVIEHTIDGVVLSRELPAGRTRFGGDAVLPSGVEWPRLSGEWYLGFLMLVALEELPPVGLPADGTLLIFEDVELMGMDRDPLVATRVFFVPAGDPLVSPQPAGKVVFPQPERPLGVRALPLPGESETVVAALGGPAACESVIAAMNEFTQPMMRDCTHTLLGCPQMWRAPMADEIRRVLRDEANAETKSRFSASLLDGQGWQLLAQLNPDYDREMGLDFLGAGGSLYLCIPIEDLRVARFDRVVGFFQTAGSFACW